MDAHTRKTLRHYFLEGFRVWYVRCNKCAYQQYSVFDNNEIPDKIECLQCQTMNAKRQREVFAKEIEKL